jgi:hypothetical protein
MENLNDIIVCTLVEEFVDHVCTSLVNLESV